MPFRRGGPFGAPNVCVADGGEVRAEWGARGWAGVGVPQSRRGGCHWRASPRPRIQSSPGRGSRAEGDAVSPAPGAGGRPPGSERRPAGRRRGRALAGGEGVPAPGPGALGRRARPHNGRKRGSALCPAGGADRRFLRPPWGRDPASPGAARPPGRAPRRPPGTGSPAGLGAAPATGKARYAGAGAGRPGARPARSLGASPRPDGVGGGRAPFPAAPSGDGGLMPRDVSPHQPPRGPGGRGGPAAPGLLCLGLPPDTPVGPRPCTLPAFLPRPRPCPRPSYSFCLWPQPLREKGGQTSGALIPMVRGGLDLLPRAPHPHTGLPHVVVKLWSICCLWRGSVTWLFHIPGGLSPL